MAQKFLSGILSTAQVSITRPGNAQDSTLVMQDNARMIKLGRDAFQVFGLDGTTAQQMYIQGNGGGVTVGGSLSTGSTLSATTDVHAGGRLRSNGGTDNGSQLCLFANSNGHTFLAGYTFQINTGGNNSRTKSFKIDHLKNSTFSGNVTIKAALLDHSSVTSATTTTTIASLPGATYAAVFFDYVIYKSSNIRAGTVVACSDGTNVEFAETSTTDLGDTSDVTLFVDYSSANIRLRATTTSSTWTIKSLIRAI